MVLAVCAYRVSSDIVPDIGVERGGNNGASSAHRTLRLNPEAKTGAAYRTPHVGRPPGHTSRPCSTRRLAFSITISATCTWRTAGSSKVEEITSPFTERCMSVTSSGRSYGLPVSACREGLELG